MKILTRRIRLHVCLSNGNQLNDMGHVMVGLTVLQRSTHTVCPLDTIFTVLSVRGGPETLL